MPRTLLVVGLVYCLLCACSERSEPKATNASSTPAAPHATARYHGPTCIAGICLATGDRPEQEFVSRFNGGRVIPYGHGHARCLAGENGHGPFVQVLTDDGAPNRILSLLVTVAPNCSGAAASTLVASDMRTPEGLGIGSKVDDVRAAYGAPDLEREADAFLMIGVEGPKQPPKNQFGDHVLIYASPENDTLSARFFVKEGLVTGLLISINE